MSVMLISVSHDTIVSNKHEEQTRHYYVNFQHLSLTQNNSQQCWPYSNSLSYLYTLLDQ